MRNSLGRFIKGHPTSNTGKTHFKIGLKAYKHKIKCKCVRCSKVAPPHAFKKGHVTWNTGLKGVQVAWNKNKKFPQIAGRNHYLWTGTRPETMRIRSSIENRLWRESIFARDNWTCQKYGIKGGKLHAHHIKNFAVFPELRLSIDNGITLSKKAHNKFHKIYGNRNNTPQQLDEFLSKEMRKAQE